MNIFNLFPKKLTPLGPLGRRQPLDHNHIEKYPYTVAEDVKNVEVELPLPSWHWEHNQGTEGACVGFAWQMAKAIMDEVRGNPWWLWDEAKKIDQWPDTNPGDSNGTSVRAAGDVLRKAGNAKWETTKPLKELGILENRWATNINEMRAGLTKKIPIVVGVNWYTCFDQPSNENGEYFVGKGDLGNVRGGHAVCIYGASDIRGAFKIKNSWGEQYPLTWIPYTTMQRLLNEGGEAALITDLTPSIEPKTPPRSVVKYRSRGLDVTYLQTSLKTLSFFAGKVDGIFGKVTEKAVKKFQLSQRIQFDGIVGKMTWEKLEEALKKKSNLAKWKLVPEMEIKVSMFLSKCEQVSVHLKITEGFRTRERQAELYAQGRTTPGKIVTFAKPGQSRHEKGIAIDVAFLGDNPYPTDDSAWKEIADIGIICGLKPGFYFKTFRDRPHFQL